MAHNLIIDFLQEILRKHFRYYMKYLYGFEFLRLISRPTVTLTKFIFIHGMYKIVHVCKYFCV